jgi:hypothetical protein
VKVNIVYTGKAMQEARHPGSRAAFLRGYSPKSPIEIGSDKGLTA